MILITLFQYTAHIRRNLEGGEQKLKSLNKGIKVNEIDCRSLVKKKEIKELCDELEVGDKSINFFLSRISYLIHKRAPKFDVPSEDDLTDEDD